MICVDEAYELLRKHISPLPAEELALTDATYHTLARPIYCDVDYPPFDRATMDGFAVRADDTRTSPARLQIVGCVPAGTMPKQMVGAGEAVQINTGAPIPGGADAVVRVEITETTDDGKQVLVGESVERGKFITKRGTYRQSGDLILDVGAVLTPVAVSAAATAGASRVAVYRKPTAAILTTGDELVGIDQTPTGAQIRNSNQFLLASLFESTRIRSGVLESAGDDRQILKDRIEAGTKYDVLAITGGISMGAFDFVPEVLEELGAKLVIQKMAVKPGRPTIFAIMPNGCLVFALPGNPASALVGFELLVRPAISALQGRNGDTPKMVTARLKGALGATTNRQSFVPALAEISDSGNWLAEPVRWHGSGDSLGMAMANALIVRRENEESLDNGSEVGMILL